jgi:diaminopimelate decarboxylase
VTQRDQSTAEPATIPGHVAVARHPERFGVRDVARHLHVEGVSLQELAERVGTPTYVYGLGEIERRYRALDAALIGVAHRICYAVKANSSPTVLETLAALGAGADIVSAGELQRALRAGIPAEKIVFSGVGKLDVEIDAALRAGVGALHVESGEELDRIAARAAALGLRARIGLRVNPDVDPVTHPYLATGMREAKFGIAMDEAEALAVDAARHPALELVGVGFHIGSQLADAEPWIDAIARMRALLERLALRGVRPRYLDIGGGLGVAYHPGETELDVQAYGHAIAHAAHGLGLPVVIEPGRWLVATAGVLLTRVIGRKVGEAKRFVIVDAGMNDLIRPALYEAVHTIVPVKLPAADTPTVRADVVGPVCESGDFLGLDRELAWPNVGDLFVVAHAGAYGMVMASNYNTRGLPAEVAVRGGTWAVIRPRQTLEELLGADITAPSWQSSTNPAR